MPVSKKRRKFIDRDRVSAQAAVDQHEQALQLLAREWPYNQQYRHIKEQELLDEGRGLFGSWIRWYRNPDGRMKFGGINVAWLSTGKHEPVPVLWGIEDFVRAHAPWEAAECDRCGNRGDYDEHLVVQSILLVQWLPHSPHLAAHQLCPGCTYLLSQDQLTRLIYKEPAGD